MIIPLRAPWWAWALTGLAVALFLALGSWQLQRGRTKERLQQALSDRAAPAEVLAQGAQPARELEPRRARATGRYLADRQLLQDGQSHEGRPGYHVWTPLHVSDGALVLVDRGWVPRHAAAAATPPPEGDVEVRGQWRTLPEPGLRLAANPCPAEKQFPAVVVYPTAAELECLLGRPVLAGLLLLDADLAGGFVRAWANFGFPPARHYGYAVQWYALAVAAVAVFVAVSRKRSA